jgi:hypothetical protein
MPPDAGGLAPNASDATALSFEQTATFVGAHRHRLVRDAHRTTLAIGTPDTPTARQIGSGQWVEAVPALRGSGPPPNGRLRRGRRRRARPERRPRRPCTTLPCTTLVDAQSVDLDVVPVGRAGGRSTLRSKAEVHSSARSPIAVSTRGGLEVAADESTSDVPRGGEFCRRQPGRGDPASISCVSRRRCLPAADTGSELWQAEGTAASCPSRGL